MFFLSIPYRSPTKQKLPTKLDSFGGNVGNILYNGHMGVDMAPYPPSRST